MIEVRGLSKRYGDKIAVNNLSFDVAPGKVTGFLGPNGAGKTTTMRLMLGLDYPDTGAVTIDGKQYACLANPMREVGALLDAKAVHGGRSAYNHLLCLAQTNNLPKRRVNEVLELVGLTEVARKRTKGFSLGMGQRLGIAGTLLGDPKILMFDEPVNGLDPEGILWIRNLMKALAGEGRTVFVSSHLMSEMEHTADYLIVIGRGELLADCTMEEFIARSSGQTVRVTTPQADQLAKAVTAAGGSAVTGDRRRAGRVRPGRRPGRRSRVRARSAAARADRGPGLARGGLHGADRGQRGVPGRRGPGTRSGPAQEELAPHGRVQRRREGLTWPRSQAPGAPVLPPASGRPARHAPLGVHQDPFGPLDLVDAAGAGRDQRRDRRGHLRGVAANGPQPRRPTGPPSTPPRSAWPGCFFLGQLVIVVFGAIVLTAEYSTGMIRTSLTAMPRRVTLFAAKAIVFAVVALVVTIVTAFVAFFLGQAILTSTHESATLSQPNVLRAVIGGALYVTLCGLFAFAAGAIFRHTAATITSIIGLLFVIPILAHLLPSNWYDDIARWLPSSTGDAISVVVGPGPDHLFSPWGQFAVFAVYTAVLLVVGGILFRKRDA